MARKKNPEHRIVTFRMSANAAAIVGPLIALKLAEINNSLKEVEFPVRRPANITETMKRVKSQLLEAERAVDDGWQKWRNNL